MLRAIHIFPAFSNAAEIDAVRSIHDPLAAKIRPHITLVFPFESDLSAEELAGDARASVAGIECFRARLGRPQIKEGVIWLPVTEGRREVIALHDALYRGSLHRYWDRSRPYEPHVTIARDPANAFEGAHESVAALRGPFEGDAVSIVVEAIMPDQSSSVESEIYLRK